MFRNFKPNTTANKSRRGLTLSELTIAMGVSGLVLSGAWGAANQVYLNYRVTRAEEMWTAVQVALTNIGPSLGTNTNLSTASNMTTVLARAGLLPGDIVDLDKGTISNPWKTSDISTTYTRAVEVLAGTYEPIRGYAVYTYNPLTGYVFPTNAFEITLNYIPTEACIQIIKNLTGPQRDPRLKSVFINKLFVAVKNGQIVNQSLGSNPSLDTIRDRCNPAYNTDMNIDPGTPNGNMIMMVYMLK